MAKSMKYQLMSFVDLSFYDVFVIVCLSISQPHKKKKI